MNKISMRFYSTCTAILFSSMIIGCFTKPVIQMPETIPPIIKNYKSLTLHGSRSSMVNTGVYVNIGDRYSILAKGNINLDGRNRMRIAPGLMLHSMIVNNGNYNVLPIWVDPELSTSDYSGNLYLGMSEGGFTEKGYAQNPDWYKDNTGAFNIDVIVWESRDLLEINKFVAKLQKGNPNSEELIELKNDIDRRRCEKASEFYNIDLPKTTDKEAIKVLTKAIEYCPGYTKAYDFLGYLYNKIGKYEKAIELLAKAAELGSLNDESYFLLSMSLFRMGEQNEAYKYINKFISIKGESPESLRLKKKIEAELDLAGPKIVLFEPQTQRGLKIIYSHENLTVRGVAIDKSGVSWVKINNYDTVIDEFGNFLKDIPIYVGANTILVEAADGLGNQSNISVMIDGQKTILPVINKLNAFEQKDKLYKNSLAVIIGINNYEKWPSLEFAVADAKAIRQKFKQTGFDHITLITDEAATKSRILTELFHELPKKVGRDDRVVFYFAGHGQTEDLLNGGKRGYIIPVDADNINFTATALSMDQIRSLSRRIPAKHILYVMDSCYSGLGLNRSSGVSPIITDYLRKVSSMRSVQIITAGGKGEQVQEKGGHGLFTTYFLKALDGNADINKDNVVSGTELGAYLRPIVSNASKQAQTPLYGRLEGEGEFLFFVKQNK